VKLVIEKSPRKFLEIESAEDGSIIKLEIKNITVSQTQENENLIKTLEEDYSGGKLSSVSYMFATMKLLVCDFDENLFNDFETAHMMQIIECVRKMQQGKSEDEKKNL